MITKQSPIGVFDSGVGGTTVAKVLIEQLPWEEIIYFGDTAHLPYGTKPKEEIAGYCLDIAENLENKGVKAIVIACNTATAAALDILKEKCSVPVIGVIEAGSRGALEATENGRIGVIATDGTVRSGVYERTILRLGNENTKVWSQGCADFVKLAEAGIWEGERADEAAERYLGELLNKAGEEKIDTLVLGCTHFPLLRNTIAKRMGSGVRLVDPALETVKELKELLEERKLLSDRTDIPRHSFTCSGDRESFEKVKKLILGF